MGEGDFKHVLIIMKLGRSQEGSSGGGRGSSGQEGGGGGGTLNMY